ncbi:MAG: [Fe-Fe] hydrogenase large subunit C-terminal domain-containing protein [Fusobacteriaceae bacterium]
MNVIGFKEARCKNCFKCVRVCEVKAITFKKDQAQILNDKCILCGECLEACPQNAKTFISDIALVKKFIKEKTPVIMSIAPSYLAAFDFETPGQVIAALKKIGFSSVRETSEGAAYITKEYAKLLEKGEMKNIVTTCCPGVNDLIEIYYPDLISHMAPLLSPMLAHGKLIKEEYGEDVKVVFLGPCIAKKREATNVFGIKGYTDAVLTFQEMKEWLGEEGINLKDLEESAPDNPDPLLNRLYPTRNGILTSIMKEKKNESKYDSFYVDGVKNCMDLFESIRKGEVENSFIEVNLCSGGCIQGPRIGELKSSRFKSKLMLEKYIKREPVENIVDSREEKEYDFSREFTDRQEKIVPPTEEMILKILKKTGKIKKEYELDCGACGYSTCREKAAAVYHGKAEISMCMSFMQEKAQSMANVVLETTPNILLIADSELKIVEFSRTAKEYFNLSKSEETYIFQLLDPEDFHNVLTTGQNIRSKKVTYPELGLTAMLSIIYIEDQNSVLGIFQDVSQEEEKLKQAYKLKMDTIEMAQKVIDKQMFVAQEIAGLLGETTAETKVTLTKLRDMIFYDGENS